MKIIDLSDKQRTALTWLTVERNKVRGDEVVMTEQEMFDGLIKQFTDINTRMDFAVIQSQAK